MAKLTTLVAVICVGMIMPVLAANYKIDPMHTNARFTLDHFATSSNVGGFYNLNGEVHYDASAKTGFVDISIPLTSLNTGRKIFDEHLLGKDFFNVGKYPTMRFVSKQWVFSKNGKVRAVLGQLTMLGQTKQVKLKANKFNCYHNALTSSEVCGGDFEGIIDRSEWGLNHFLAEIPASRFVKLNIQVEAVKQ
ncbi:hypothetical protein SASC598O02_007780 [Snodgrassella alvi SCGC AB-598-O02]|nr:YceI family protein [Snodgrassella alvi]KES10773.1 hypothetical protein SASC598O02_007780 [Snodgrassella alvi SCGC AB-598-O02]